VVWTSAGTEPQGDPGHIHSVTRDPANGNLVAFSDRPIVEGVSGPDILISTNNGATFTAHRTTSRDHPNFVAPMYFGEYIGWASDNQINGRFSRIKRTDFYAANWHKTEHVAQLSQKAAYY